MKRTVLALAVFTLVALAGCVGENRAAPPADTDVVAKKGGDDRTGPYDVVEGWWKPAPNHDEEWAVGPGCGRRGRYAKPHHRGDSRGLAQRPIAASGGAAPTDELHRRRRRKREHRGAVDAVGLDSDTSAPGLHQPLRPGAPRLGHRQRRRRRPHAGLEVLERREDRRDAARREGPPQDP